MKNAIVPLLIVSAAMIFASLPGCTNSTSTTPGVNGSPPITNTVRKFDPEVVITGIQAVVPFGVIEAVRYEPQAKLYLQASVAAINAFALGDNLTPEALDAAVVAVIPKASAPNTLAAINAGVALYELAYTKVISGQLDKVTYLKPILTALAGAIQQGLNAAP